MSEKKDACQQVIDDLAVRVVELENVLSQVLGRLPNRKVPSFVDPDHEYEMKMDANTIRAVENAMANVRPPVTEVGKTITAYAVREAEVRRCVSELANFTLDRKGKLPFFSEASLYDLIGKDDARSVLSRLRSVQEALAPGANMVRDPRAECIRQLLRDLERDAGHYENEANRLKREFVDPEKKSKKPASSLDPEYYKNKMNEHRASAHALRTTMGWVEDLLTKARREPKDDY